MSRKLWYLKQLNLFKDLSQVKVKKISGLLSEKEYTKNQVVLEPKDKDKIFILKSGRVEIYKLTQDGKKVIVDTLGPGNVFGDLGVDQENDNFIEATTDSYVCTIQKEVFFEMVSNNPKIANTLVKELFSKIVESEKQVAALASDNIYIKIKELLFRLAKKHGERQNDEIRITVKFTHEQLAEMIGTSRQTMTEMLGKLEKRGVIKRQGKIISYYPQKLTDLQKFN